MEEAPQEDVTELIDDEAYRTERLETFRHEYGDAEHYDKWLLTLAAGMFGLSITFIRYIAPEPRASTLTILVFSWFALALSVTGTLLSLQASQVGWRKYRDILDARRVGEPLKSETNYGAKVTNFLNYWSLAWFIVGVILLAAFSFSNLPVGE